jgi:hypothetical protein
MFIQSVKTGIRRSVPKCPCLRWATPDRHWTHGRRLRIIRWCRLRAKPNSMGIRNSTRDPSDFWSAESVSRSPLCRASPNPVEKKKPESDSHWSRKPPIHVAGVAAGVQAGPYVGVCRGGSRWNSEGLKITSAQRSGPSSLESPLHSPSTSWAANPTRISLTGPAAEGWSKAYPLPAIIILRIIVNSPAQSDQYRV